MSIVRVGPWSIGDKLTTAQINSVDLNASYGADKRSGQTDTIQSVWTASGAGRLIKSYVAGATTNTTYTLSGGCSFIDAGSTSISGTDVTYTLSATGANVNDTVEVRGNGAKPVVVKDGPSSAVLATLIPQSGTEKAVAEFSFDGTNWSLRRVTGNGNRTRFSTLRPVHWTGAGAVYANNTSGPPTLSGDEAIWVSNVRQWEKDAATALPATGGSLVTTPCPLPVPTSGTLGIGYGFFLDSRHLIDGKTLSSVAVQRRRTSSQPVTGFFRFYIRRTVPLTINDTGINNVYLSSAAYPQAAVSSEAAGTNIATLTCNQNNVIDLAQFVYYLIVIMGPTNEGFVSLDGATFVHT